MSARNLAWLAVAGVIMMSAAGACLLATGQVTVGAWVLAAACCNVLVSVSYISGGQLLWLEAKDSIERGDLVACRSIERIRMEEEMAGMAQRRWVGSGAMPGSLGYVRATTPLVVLEVVGSCLTLRARPKFIAKFLGISALQAAAGDDIVILLARSGWMSGIEFRVPGIPSYYLWTVDQKEIFTILSDTGFTVSAAEGQ